MRYFLDTEFNGFGGDSVALAVAPEDDKLPPFYEAVPCLTPTEWVAEHVLPVLQTRPLAYNEVSRLFCEYLEADRLPILVADWPEDIVHAARLLTNGGGRRLRSSPVRFELLATADFSAERVSHTPHNAYWDALALRTWVLGNEPA